MSCLTFDKKLQDLSRQTPFPQAEMLAALLPMLNSAGRRYRKCRNILAKHAQGGEKIATVTADGLETTNTAQKGDYIIQNTTDAGEQYILAAEKFEKKYSPISAPNDDGWQTYRPNSVITALELTAETLLQLQWPPEFHFTARWGEAMIAKTGDFLALPADHSEVYRIARKEFFETYEEEGGE
jgi:hypothetical protein